MSHPSTSTRRTSNRGTSARLATGFAFAGLTALSVTLATGFTIWPSSLADAGDPPAAAAPPAMPVSVATVEAKPSMSWDEFSGRLEAVGRVELRARVSGALEEARFREGALVKKGDLLVTIDPAPYQATLDRAQAQVSAAEARLAYTKSEMDRGQRLVDAKVVSVQELDQRVNNYKEAEANLRAAKAAVVSAQLDLDHTQVRAPIDGRVGRLEVTPGNLVADGPTAPVLTTIVSVNPIYVSFDADEDTVGKALASIGDGPGALDAIDRIPIEISTGTTGDTPVRGHLQLVNNEVEAATGTLRLRGTFDNADGRLKPGQFARVRMGRARTEPAIVINERAVGTDQDKKFVFVVDAGNKAIYREVKLGAPAEGLRIVTSGLKPGETIVVNGLQRVRPGAVVAPEKVPMTAKAEGTPARTDIAAGD
ncbi:efflux RND transporter periplasmic adaptor subunit [Ancylobacter sp. 6x-1]|uniref:Efflux RND transporter periplasmic adaptor subunit n=1 Tax=Ancylobacter crimeensis TaxID=2579147 RepID=A0ABT0DFB2_9HYPH|nr:efflux RND transporter periplasmic adaptor subunit [Ancylobacter crimeensis]MCK0198656.1 efflux RND transporter periplasmic adaptor subunit [Ancylobacter crimeensis]